MKPVRIKSGRWGKNRLYYDGRYISDGQWLLDTKEIPVVISNPVLNKLVKSGTKFRWGVKGINYATTKNKEPETGDIWIPSLEEIINNFPKDAETTPYIHDGKPAMMPFMGCKFKTVYFIPKGNSQLPNSPVQEYMFEILEQLLSVETLTVRATLKKNFTDEVYCLCLFLNGNPVGIFKTENR